MDIEHNRYQYLLDLEGLAGKPQPGWQNHLHDEGGAPLDLHFRLFDEEGNQAGELIDPATGKKIDNSTFSGLEGLEVLDSNFIDNRETEDLLGPIIESVVIQGESGAADVAATLG